ncbi:MAG: TonB family protein [Pyrinomonadaceae bacterium]
MKYEDGLYEFVFPMTVGQRYIPASVKAEDAQKISPTIATTRAGHDISIEVNLDAGVPVEEIRSNSHEIQTINFSPNNAKITLLNEKTMPNKDFILRYDVTGKRIEDAVLTHRDERGGFFTLILQPPDKFAVEDVTPKEIVFVLDTSGSMSGFPIEKAKEAMRLSLEGLYPQDTFNLISFAGDTSILFDAPVPATQANMERALEFLDEKRGYGGTEMMTAIKAALEPTDSQEHLRIVCFMTDGYVGNENEIIAEVQKHPNARVFSFGIGNSVNRFLLDKLAEAGRGEVEYVSLQDDGSKAARKFYERVRTPLLTDVSVDWNGLPVADVYPNRISDLFSAKPVILHGRFTNAASGTIRLKGKVSGQDLIREIPVNFPETENKNDVLATLWARTRIDDLVNEVLKNSADEKPESLELKKRNINTITQIGLEYRLLTQFTSFVAVEERIVNRNGKPKKIEVPVEQADGTLREADSPFRRLEIINSLNKPPSVKLSGKGSGRGYGSGNGIGNGSGSGRRSRRQAEIINTPASVSGLTVSRSATVSGGVVNGKAANLPVPPYPATARAVGASGAVNVQIVIDETGNVMSASAVSGHPLLRQSAEAAARKAKFYPTLIGGKPVKVTGLIVYNFVDTQNSATVALSEIRVDEKDLPKPITPEFEKEMKHRQMLAEKFHFWIFAVVERLQQGVTKTSENEVKFISDGKAEVQIRLKTTSPEALEKLKNSGFEIINERNEKIINGKIAIEKLAELAEIAEVEYVLPIIK